MVIIFCINMVREPVVAKINLTELPSTVRGLQH